MQGLLDGVAQLEGTADADAALALARQLLVLADQAVPDDAPALANAVNRLGVFFSNRAYDDEARRVLLRALALAGGAGDGLLLAQVHNNLGQLDERGGDLAGAAAHLETALGLHRSAGTHPIDTAFTADNLGSVLVRQGQLDRAEALQREALATLARAGPRFRADVATVLGNLGLLYKRRGDIARAKAHLLRAIDTHLQVHPLERGDARIPLTNLIGLLLQHGPEALADEMIDLLLRIGGERIGAAQQATAIALLELAEGAFARFQLGIAERVATRALAILEQSAGAAAPPTLRALQLLANVHGAKGNTDSAEQGLARALAGSGLTPAKTAELLIDYGKTLRARGPSAAAAAIGIFERAIALLRQAPSLDRPRLASALGNLALARFDRDEAARAQALYEEALALGPPRTLGGAYPWLLYSQALLHYHLGAHDPARRGMQRAIALWSRSLGARHPFVATAHDNLALVQWSSGRRAAAQRSFDTAAQLEAGTLQRLLLVGSERQRLETARDQWGDLFKRVSFCFDGGARGAAARSAAQLLLQRKGAVLDAMAGTQARLRDQLDAAARQRLDRLAEVQRQLGDAALSSQLLGGGGAAAERAGLEREEAQLQSELSHAGALGVGALLPVTLEQVRAALPAGASLVEILRWSRFEPQRSGRGIPWRGTRYAAMVLRAKGEPRWFDLGDAQAIDGETQALLALLRDADSDSDAVRAASQALHAQLIGPFERLLTGSELLLIAPDGGLNLLPFGVLGAPMLAERFTVCHLGSGRDLVRQAAQAPASGAVLAFVDPDFDAEVGAEAAANPGAPAALQLQPLPGTRAEGAAIQTHFPGSRILAGAAASADALRAVQRPAILHIGTHGVFSLPAQSQWQAPQMTWLAAGDEAIVLQRGPLEVAPDPMRHAGLALAGANRSAPGRPLGFIAAKELAALDLRGTELVVLSACDTGLGVAAHGEEFAGLRRAFAIAGAASQVISLWAVEDEAAAALMQAFYAQLAQGVGRAKALQQAQAAVRRRPRFAHPSAWAAFVAWGDAGPLSAATRGAAAP